MEFTADTLVSRAAHELGPRADQLIRDVERSLRHEVPELWEEPSIARMTSENIAEHVVAALFGIEMGIEPGQIEPPAAEIERARRLARHGTPISTMLRALRLAQAIILDRILEEMPRLTSDEQLVGAAARKLLATAAGYVDRTAEQGVQAFQEERDRRLQWRLSVVNEASKRIGTTLDISRTTQELADVATEHFADLVTVDLLESVLRGSTEPNEEPLVLSRIAQCSVDEARSGPDVPPRQPHTYPVGSPPDRALTTGQASWQHAGAALHADRPVTPEEHGPTAAADGFHLSLVVPLCARGATLGVAQFFRYRNPDPFHDEDLLLAQEIAASAAVAVDNARRYTHARATALALQRSLLPRGTPEQSAVEVACRYLPAAAEFGVGGDWYDVIPLSGARVALVVGDVVGHGIQAAATMGRLRTAVRTLADIDLPPDELLTHLDDVVLRLSTDPDDDTDSDIGATCLYAVYDPVSSRCTLARAGHILPIVVTRDGSTDVLDLPPGPPLGLGGLPFEAVEVELPGGSILALYTDGLVESREHDIETGLGRLRQALAQPAHSLEASCDSVLQALLPGRPHDEVALLLARTRTLGALRVATWDLQAEPAAVSRARASVSEQLSAWGLEQFDFTAELVVSELVTNAIRYGSPPVRLRLINDGNLLCEVSDASSTTPHQRRARTYDEGGRGLLLVAQLAEHWGTRHARHGKTVWAELTDSSGLPVPSYA